jgi:putative ribosome biogenesis GTPase RsgA
LQKIFEVLRVIDRKNVILALGNTGCGKSTLLNSLLFGPGSLELRTITEKLASGRDTKKAVIE